MLCKTQNDLDHLNVVIKSINKQYEILIQQHNSVDKHLKDQGELDILNKIKTKLIELKKESEQILTLFTMVCNSKLWEGRYNNIKSDYETLQRASPQSILQSPTSVLLPQNQAALPAPPAQNQLLTSAFTSIANNPNQAVPPTPPQNQPSQELISMVEIVSEKLIENNIIIRENARHLYKPPIRFLFDIINDIISKSNFAKGLYDEDELTIKSEVTKESKPNKIKYLWKIFTCVSRYDNSFLVDLSRIDKILKGSDALYVNQFLIKLLECMDKPLNQNIVNQVREESLTQQFIGGKKEKTKRRQRRQKISRKK
jgi:hypothetical protein